MSEFYRVTFQDGKTRMDYLTLGDAVRWGMAGRWGARNLWHYRDGKRKAVAINRYPTAYGASLGVVP